MWAREDGSGFERCVMEATSGGWRVAGTVLLVVDDVPHEIRYAIQTDQNLTPQTVGAHVQAPGADRRMALRGDGSGSWFAEDRPVLDLYGAVDVNLAWTPATTMLTLRRLGLRPGQSADTVSAWIGFPDHSLRRITEHYERLDATTYRYAAGDVAVDLAVDELGRILEYPARWTAIAISSGR